MTSISKNVYIDKLDEIVNKHISKNHKNDACRWPSIYIDFNKEDNTEGHKFKVGDNVRISKYKSIFVKAYFPNWSEDVFVFKKVKSTVWWAYVISDLNGEEIVGTLLRKGIAKNKSKRI